MKYKTAAILYCICTALSSITFIMNLTDENPRILTIVLNGLCAVLFAVSAILSFKRAKKEASSDKTEDTPEK